LHLQDPSPFKKKSWSAHGMTSGANSARAHTHRLLCLAIRPRLRAGLPQCHLRPHINPSHLLRQVCAFYTWISFYQKSWGFLTRGCFSFLAGGSGSSQQPGQLQKELFFLGEVRVLLVVVLPFAQTYVHRWMIFSKLWMPGTKLKWIVRESWPTWKSLLRWTAFLPPHLPHPYRLLLLMHTKHPNCCKHKTTGRREEGGCEEGKNENKNVCVQPCP